MITLFDSEWQIKAYDAYDAISKTVNVVALNESKQSIIIWSVWLAKHILGGGEYSSLQTFDSYLIWVRTSREKDIQNKSLLILWPIEI